MPKTTPTSSETQFTSFYKDLPSFSDFGGFTDQSRYRPLPDGWQVILADIRGSTQAIVEGRYKDVNMMGAACISTVLNTLKNFDPVPDVPYVFGGDGATLAVPAYTVDKIRDALLRTRTLSEAQFGLEMRIGIVPVTDVRAKGKDVFVAKFRLSHGNHLALFTGGGIAMVDAMVKDEIAGAPYRAELSDETAPPDLEGLSCRWSPIKARRGNVVSVLVQSSDTDNDARASIYKNALAHMTEALKQDLNELSPATDRNLKFYWPPKKLWTEAKATAGYGIFALPKRLAVVLYQSAVQWVLHRTGGKAGGYDAPAYKTELIANTDFRRFDDTLRLVIDCSDEQLKDLEHCLATLRRTGGISYGLHSADTALMTCLLFSLEKSEHVHFIDGGDGGFAIAAKQLKAQLEGIE